MIALALALVAGAVLVWPPTGAVRRCRRLAGTPVSRSGGSRGLRVGAIALLSVVAVGFCVAAVVAAGIVVALAFWRAKRARRRDRAQRDVDQIKRALVVIVAEMRAGAPVVLACREAVVELGDDAAVNPVAAALARMASCAELGAEPTAEPGDPPGIDRIGRAWKMSAASGLPMVDLMESLRTDLAARQEFSERTAAGLAGPRATAAVLAGLPVLGIGLGQLMGARPLAVLMGSGVGGVLLVSGVSLAAAGVVWSDAIIGRVLR